MITKEIAGHNPPEFKALFKDMRVRPGEPCRLEVQVVGAPKPKVRWQIVKENVGEYQIKL